MRDTLAIGNQGKSSKVHGALVRVVYGVKDQTDTALLSC